MKNLDKKTPMTDAERQAKRRHKLKMDSLNKDVIFITLNYLITKLECGEIDKDEFIDEIKNLKEVKN